MLHKFLISAMHATCRPARNLVTILTELLQRPSAAGISKTQKMWVTRFSYRILLQLRGV